MVKLLNKKKSKKDPELFSYESVKREKLWGYRHRYYNSLGQRKEASKHGFQSETSAYRALLEVKVNLSNGVEKLVEHTNITVSEWLDIWMESNRSRWKPTTIKQRELAIRLQMKPLLGHYKLQQLEKSVYQRVFINELIKTYKINTVLLFHRLFKVAINAAVEEDIIQRNKFTKIVIEDNSPLENKNTNYYNGQELNAFLESSEKCSSMTAYIAFKVLAYSGMRRGEALGLKWSDINFETNAIYIYRTRDNKGVRTPKTKNSIRTIAMDPEVMNELKKYQLWTKQKMLEFGFKWSLDSFVFISQQTGEPITDGALLYSMRKAQDKAELRRITIHGLRHTHATLLMLDPSINVKTIAERLGNTVDMIHSIYGHVLEEMEKQSVLSFSKIMQESKSDLKVVR